ncbi:MAG TPA: MBL fold metallo-hydrolase [bacterium]|nr:MBL fold metallo-hydrolase [bacterium]
MAVIDEVGPDLFRISVFASKVNLQFNHFLVRDEQPLLFHTGLKETFPLVRDAVAGLIELSRLRWIGFSHVESDECGSLAEWLAAAPGAQPLCSQIGARVNRDFTSSVKAARGMADGESLETGKYRFRFCRTAQLPHGWDAGLLFEETTRTLLCSDLLHQNGDCAAVVGGDVVERCRQAILEYQTGVLADYVPYSPRTAENMRRLAALEPRTLAAMHGSTFVGDGAQALRDLDIVLREVFGTPI